MKILVLGASGFMGKHFKEIFPKKYVTLLQYKDTWDLLDSDQVKGLLFETQPDIVINCITYGGNDKVNETDTQDLTKNLAMAYNFYKHSDLFKLYINLSSGVEKNYEDCSAYAVSKRLIKEMLLAKNKFVNLCVYGCFGKYEKDRRLFKRILECQRTGEPLHINDKYFDYISIQDLARIIDSVIAIFFSDLRYEMPRDIDCVYPDKKKKLSDIVSLFCEVNNINIKIEIDSDDNINKYVGSLHGLSYFIDCGLTLFGPAHGMKEYMND